MAARATRPRVSEARQVFVNCPYDDGYLPLLRVLVFTVHACGFRARLAAEVSTSGTPRLKRIIEIIRACQLGIHDLSRVQIDPDAAVPRFNMPFECGLFLGAQAFGDRTQRSKDWLLLEAEPHRHQRSISDAAGLDPEVHGDDPVRLVAAVRRFLAGHIEPRPVGPADLRRLYEEFEQDYPRLASEYGHAPEELREFSNFDDWLWIATEWLARRAVQSGAASPAGRRR